MTILPPAAAAATTTAQQRDLSSAGGDAAGGEVRLVDAKDFHATLKEATTPVLVDFFASWCHPCRMLKPTLHALAKQYDTKLKVITVDCESSEAIAQEHKITALPTVVLFDKGQDIGRFTGVRNQKSIEEFLKARMPASSSL